VREGEEKEGLYYPVCKGKDLKKNYHASLICELKKSGGNTGKKENIPLLLKGGDGEEKKNRT